MRLRAYAKVNLTLEVLGKRPDGYHEIASVLQTVDLADDLTFEPAAELAVECDAPGLSSDDNLVLQAARLLKREMQVPQGARISLRKRVPIAAGLGGGSSDAAAALLGLSRLWELHLGPRELLPIAAQLGSDVPFFLFGGTALAGGRGEVVTPLPPCRDAWLVLATPPIQVARKTATLYGALRPAAFTGGEATERLVQALRAGAPPSSSHLFNVFEEVAELVFPGLTRYRATLLDAGAPSVHLTGSGPTLFCLASGPEEGAALQRRWAALGLEAYVVKTVAGSL